MEGMLCAGLTGPFPELPTSLVHIMQVFDVAATNFSQTCSANSKTRGGSDNPIAVGRLTNLVDYTSCLPNFLKFDTNVMRRKAYADDFICPAVRWNSQIADDGTMNAPDLDIPVSPCKTTPSEHHFRVCFAASCQGDGQFWWCGYIL